MVQSSNSSKIKKTKRDCLKTPKAPNPTKLYKTMENQPFEDVSPIKKLRLSIVMLVFGGVIIHNMFANNGVFRAGVFQKIVIKLQTVQPPK